VILTSLPDLPPRPATLANAEFRRNFYARWGRENAIVCGQGRDVEYAVLTQQPSIKRVCGGAERSYLRERELAVDDDNYLVLNQGQRYGSRLRGARSVFSFAFFFRPGLVEEVAVRAAWRATSCGGDCTSQPTAWNRTTPSHSPLMIWPTRHASRAGTLCVISVPSSGCRPTPT
jgi:hypothetical protein